jgi:predicted phage terminase large subunit-like protein
MATLEFGQRNRRRAWGAPRGSAKSTVATLLKPIHDVCYGLENFIVIISNTAPLAEQKLKGIRDEILANDDLRLAYGLRFPTKSPGATQFLVHNADGHSCFFMAFGKGAQVRGARHGPHRPSKILLDDVEHSDEVENELLRQKDQLWFSEDVSKLGDEHTNIEAVGTILHRESLLAGLLANPAYSGQIYRSVINWSPRPDLWEQWRSIYINLDNPNRIAESQAFYQANEPELLRDTHVLWPEKEPYLYLMQEMIEIGRSSFYKEKQNEPLGAKDKVFNEIHWYEEVENGIRVLNTGAFIHRQEYEFDAAAAIDPATGKEKPTRGKPGDYACILQGFKDRQNRVLVNHCYMERHPPSKYTAEIFELYDRLKFSRMTVESNLYRELLLENIKAERVRRQKVKNSPAYAADLKFYEVDQTENKRERIVRLEPKVTHGWILFNKKLKGSLLHKQLEDFPHAVHDDGPDCLEILWNTFHNKYSLGGVNKRAMG